MSIFLGQQDHLPAHEQQRESRDGLVPHASCNYGCHRTHRLGSDGIANSSSANNHSANRDRATTPIPHSNYLNNDSAGNLPYRSRQSRDNDLTPVVTRTGAGHTVLVNSSPHFVIHGPVNNSFNAGCEFKMCKDNYDRVPDERRINTPANPINDGRGNNGRVNDLPYDGNGHPNVRTENPAINHNNGGATNARSTFHGRSTDNHQRRHHSSEEINHSFPQNIHRIASSTHSSSPNGISNQPFNDNRSEHSGTPPSDHRRTASVNSVSRTRRSRRFRMNSSSPLPRQVQDE